MKVELRRGEIMGAASAIAAFGARECNQRLAYALAKLRRQLADEVVDIQTALKQGRSARWVEYERKRAVAEQRSRGLPDAAAALAEVDRTYADVAEEMLAADERSRAFLSEMIEVDLYAIQWAWLPETFKAADLGPLVVVVVGGEVEREEDGGDHAAAVDEPTANAGGAALPSVAERARKKAAGSK